MSALTAVVEEFVDALLVLQSELLLGGRLLLRHHRVSLQRCAVLIQLTQLKQYTGHKQLNLS